MKHLFLSTFWMTAASEPCQSGSRMDPQSKQQFVISRLRLKLLKQKPDLHCKCLVPPLLNLPENSGIIGWDVLLPPPLKMVTQNFYKNAYLQSQ